MRKTKEFTIMLSKSKLIIFTLIFAMMLGVVLGACLPKKFEKLFFGENTVVLFTNAFSSCGNFKSIILNRLFVDMFSLAIFLITSISFGLIVVNVFILFYRGYIMGAVMIAMISNFGFSGLLAFLFIIFLQNLLSNLALIFYTSVSNYYLRKSKQCKVEYKIKDTLPALFISFSLIVMGIVFVFLIVILFLRPFNYSL